MPAHRYWAEDIKDRTSLEKVENVVKPPQKPTIANRAHEEPLAKLFVKRPIRKQPSTFTASVPHKVSRDKLSISKPTP